MTDDLDDLKSMMDRATPRPDAARRAENLALAQKNFAASQGSRDAARHTPAQEAKGLWTGVRHMLNVFTSKAALTASTAIVACGVLFLVPIGQRDQETGPEGVILDLAQTPSNAAEPVPAVAPEAADTVMSLEESAPVAEGAAQVVRRAATDAVDDAEVEDFAQAIAPLRRLWQRRPKNGTSRCSR